MHFQSGSVKPQQEVANPNQNSQSSNVQLELAKLF